MNNTNFRYATFLLFPMLVVSVACGDDAESDVPSVGGTSWGEPGTSVGWTPESASSTARGSSTSGEPDEPDKPQPGTTGSAGSSDTGTPDPDTCGAEPSAERWCAFLVEPHGQCARPPLFTELQCNAKFGRARGAPCHDALIRELLCLAASACDDAPEDVCADEIAAYEAAC